jgi:hypothetical protein
MGATQKALARGIPVCAVPFGRDQFEVARRVQVAGAGTRLPANRLRPDRLRTKVREAMTCTEGARRVGAGFAAAGGACCPTAGSRSGLGCAKYSSRWRVSTSSDSSPATSGGRPNRPGYLSTHHPPDNHPSSKWVNPARSVLTDDRMMPRPRPQADGNLWTSGTLWPAPTWAGSPTPTWTPGSSDAWSQFTTTCRPGGWTAGRHSPSAFSARAMSAGIGLSMGWRSRSFSPIHQRSGPWAMPVHVPGAGRYGSSSMSRAGPIARSGSGAAVMTGQPRRFAQCATCPVRTSAPPAARSWPTGRV